MVPDNYKSSTTGCLIISSTDSAMTSVCDANYEEYYPLPCLIEMLPIPKNKLTKWDKRQMFKIANQKHSRRPR